MSEPSVALSGSSCVRCWQSATLTKPIWTDQTAALTGRESCWKMGSGKVHDKHHPGYNPNKHSFLLQFILLTITTPKCDTLLIPEDKLSSLFRREVRLSRASAGWSWCAIEWNTEMSCSRAFKRYLMGAPVWLNTDLTLWTDISLKLAGLLRLYYTMYQQLCTS